MAARCDETAHLLPDLQKAAASAKLVAPERLAEAVSRYIDWEAFAYWVRRGLELGPPLPEEVARELRRCCSGFLEVQTGKQGWQQLMSWIAERNFNKAKREGWFEAILLFAHRHPRASRTMEYADHCDEVWGSKLPDPYPSFDEWRRNANSYIEAADGLAQAVDS